ncbi:Uncharacterized protein GBIM_08128 [Gryllus bimaculatus]|nr:Uncharacterized protein GBIM_08128 [Gryllus bimaculatus]
MSLKRLVLPVEQQLGLVCFRLRGSDQLNQKLLGNINASGRLHMVPASVNDKYVIRFCAVAQDASDADVGSWLLKLSFNPSSHSLPASYVAYEALPATYVLRGLGPLQRRQILRTALTWKCSSRRRMFVHEGARGLVFSEGGARGVGLGSVEFTRARERWLEPVGELEAAPQRLGHATGCQIRRAGGRAGGGGGGVGGCANEDGSGDRQSASNVVTATAAAPPPVSKA